MVDKLMYYFIVVSQPGDYVNASDIICVLCDADDDGKRSIS